MTRKGYEELKLAIILQAAKDFEYAIRVMRKEPKTETQIKRYNLAKRLKKDCEKFFRSDWYLLLAESDVSGEWIMDYIRKGEGHDTQRVFYASPQDRPQNKKRHGRT